VEADLQSLFEKYGQVASIAVRRNEKHRKVYAFVLYHKPSEATEALEKYPSFKSASTASIWEISS
jgi:RNA recognition motif-containing protein